MAIKPAPVKRPGKIVRLPRHVNIPAAALPRSVAQQSSATAILMDTPPPSIMNTTLPGGAAPAKLRPADIRRANRDMKLATKQSNRLAKYNLINDKGQASINTGTVQSVDYNGVLTGPTDASQFVAPNLPTLPGITNAAIEREKKRKHQLEKDINKLNKFNRERNLQASSIALGLDQPADFTQIAPGGQTGAIGTGDPMAPPQYFDPNAGGYPAPSYYPPPQGGYPPPMGYPPAGGGYEPYYPPSSGGGGPIYASELTGQEFYDPGLQNYNDPSLYAWQDTIPLDLPNMGPDGELLFMEADDSLFGDRSMREAFAGHIDPLDSFGAYSAEAVQANWLDGLTNLVKTATPAALNIRDARYNAQLAAQADQRKLAQAKLDAARAGKKGGISTGAMVGIGVGVLAIIGILAMRRK